MTTNEKQHQLSEVMEMYNTLREVMGNKKKKSCISKSCWANAYFSGEFSDVTGIHFSDFIGEAMEKRFLQ